MSTPQFRRDDKENVKDVEVPEVLLRHFSHQPEISNQEAYRPSTMA